MKKCSSCDNPLPISTYFEIEGQKIPLYHNVLEGTFHGGYGLFFDDIDELDKMFVLCHDCAHTLCEQNPWIVKLLDPYHAHSHSTEYRQSHPDHSGFDCQKKENSKKPVHV